MNITKDILKKLLSRAYDEGRTGYIDLKEEWLNLIISDIWVDVNDASFDKYRALEKQILEKQIVDSVQAYPTGHWSSRFFNYSSPNPFRYPSNFAAEENVL